MNYGRFSDLELVDAFLSRREERPLIRDELFGRYYERFDRRIRAVLYSCGLSYSSLDSYYNEIFIDLYEQVYDEEALEVILCKYDPARGSFPGWFLNCVVVNKVRDWLRRRDKLRGCKNIEWVKTTARREITNISLHEPINKSGGGLRLAEVVPYRTQKGEDTETEGGIKAALAGLPPPQQLTLKLLFVAYYQWTESDLKLLARELDLSPLSIKEQLARLARELREAPKFAESRKVELALASLFQQEESLQKKLLAVEKELSALSARGVPPEDCPGLNLKDIDRARRELELSYQKGRIDEGEFLRSSLLLRRQDLAARLAKTGRKRERLLGDYESGKYFVFPSYKELAGLLRIPEGTVASRINRSMARVKGALRKEEKRPNMRTNKVDNNFVRGDTYV